jgi:hypothetical protein
MMMKDPIRVGILSALICVSLYAEPTVRIHTLDEVHTNLPGFSLDFRLNMNAFSGGDRLVLTCAVTNTSPSAVTLNTPDLGDEWTFGFDTTYCSSSGPYPPRVPTPRTNTLLRGEGMLVVKDYIVPENISFQAWRAAVRSAQENRAEHYARFVPQTMSSNAFAIFAAKALPTNIPPCFSFQTTLCLPIVTSTTTYWFVEVVLSNIPIRATEEAEQPNRETTSKTARSAPSEASHP